VRDNERKFKNE